MAAFCSSCGSALTGGVRFCPSCGAAVGGQPAATQPTASVPPTITVPPAAPQIVAGSPGVTAQAPAGGLPLSPRPDTTPIKWIAALTIGVWLVLGTIVTLAVHLHLQGPSYLAYGKVWLITLVATAALCCWFSIQSVRKPHIANNIVGIMGILYGGYTVLGGLFGVVSSIKH